MRARISAPPARRGGFRPSFVAAVGAIVVLSPALADAQPDGKPARPALHLDRTYTKASPFRLSIDRSEYTLGAGTNRTAPRSTAQRGNARLSPLIERQARSRGIDPALVHAVIRAESAYRPEAISPKGAIGLMQVMPDTGKRFGVTDLLKPENNLRAGTIYLRYLLDRYGNVPLALAAYNAGEGAVERHGQTIPPYPETQAYVKGILREYWDGTIPGAPFQYSYIEGARLEGLDLSPYRLSSQ